MATVAAVLPQKNSHRSDAASWEKARIVIDVDCRLAQERGIDGKGSWQMRHKAARIIREIWTAYEMPWPPPSFISNVRRLYQLWPDVFDRPETQLPLQHYMWIASCSLPEETKYAMRSWAEETHPRSVTLRQHIRCAVKGMLTSGLLDDQQWRATRAARKVRQACVYFVRSGAFIKIGFTRNLTSRLQSIKTSASLPILLMATIPGTPADEVALHNRFAQHRSHGEWFHCCEEILAFIERLAVEHKTGPGKNQLTLFGRNA